MSHGGPANRNLATGFECIFDGGGPTVAQIATAITMAVRMHDPAVPLHILAAQLSHLSETYSAIFAIDQGEQC